MSSIQTYAVTGMTCGHCQSAISSEVSQIAEVERVDISVATGRMVVTASAPVDDATVVAAVDKAGYQAQPTVAEQVAASGPSA